MEIEIRPYKNILKEKEKHRKKLINADFNKKLQILSQLQERAMFFGKMDVKFRFDENYKFEDIVDIIEELKKEKLLKDYVLGGSVALLYYTQPTILTTDIDIFITPIKNSSIFDLSDIYNYLKTEYKAEEKKEWIEIKGNPIQFLSPDKGLHGDAFKNAVKVTVGNKKFKIFTLEYLIAIMLFYYKQKYEDRLKQIMREKKYKIQKLSPILKKYNLENRWTNLN